MDSLKQMLGGKAMKEKDIKIMKKVDSRVTREHSLKFMDENEGRIQKMMEKLNVEQIESEEDEVIILR